MNSCSNSSHTQEKLKKRSTFETILDEHFLSFTSTVAQDCHDDLRDDEGNDSNGDV